jgi:hypothetical protein
VELSGFLSYQQPSSVESHGATSRPSVFASSVARNSTDNDSFVWTFAFAGVLSRNGTTYMAPDCYGVVYKADRDGLLETIP